jgi:protein-disulfide isomerase
MPRESRRVDALLAGARRQARRLGVDGTPTFFLLRPSRPPQRIRPDALTYDSVSSAIRSALE